LPSILLNRVTTSGQRIDTVYYFYELLVQTYKPKNVPEVIPAKTGESWSQTKYLPNECIDYYNYFHKLLEDLNEVKKQISMKSDIHDFTFTLGVEFKTIQNNFQIDDLPTEWNTQDWPSLLVVCRNY
jgi:hypothetical protein